MKKSEYLFVLIVPFLFYSCQPATSKDYGDPVNRDTMTQHPIQNKINPASDSILSSDSPTESEIENIQTSNENSELKNPSASISKHKVRKEKYAQIRFYRDQIDFGNITEGDSLEFQFDFINEGNDELIFEHVEMSCGCTSLEYPKEPVQPGETGKIKVMYDSNGKVGRQAPNITLVSNSRKNRYSILELKGVVYPQEKKEESDSTNQG